MKYYNSLYTTTLNSLIISFSTVSMELPSTELVPSRLPEHVAKQLIGVHNIHEQEKKELLANIIASNPKQNPDKNFSVYTPKFFKDMAEAIQLFKKTSDNTTRYEETLKEQAIDYIIYVVTNQKWQTTKDKLDHIEECFADNTLLYLQATWEMYKPKYIVTITQKEEPQETGTVEEVFSEEESEETPKQPLKQLTYTKEQTKKSELGIQEKQQPSTKKPEVEPSLFNKIVTFAWNTITNTVNYIFSLFGWKQ